MSPDRATQLGARRAVEALRAGVPCSAAVDALDTGQRSLETRFRELLDSSGDSSQQPGFLFRGGFGTGKSHLLTSFEHIALAKGLAVSRVVISKETPLHDPTKLLTSAAEAVRSPDALDRGIDPIARRLRGRESDPDVLALGTWLAEESGLNARFAASLSIYTLGFRDEDLADRVVRFWSGDNLGVADIRRALRELGQQGTFTLEPVKRRDLAIETLSFLPRLVRTAGLGGLVLLIDEVELIGRYSRLQRARAYAELARWLGVIDDEDRPGFLVVGAISDDFEDVILDEKGDADQIVPYMAGRGEEWVAAAAKEGMAAIRAAERLVPPSDDVLRQTYGTLRTLHGRAYGWSPPDVTWPETRSTVAMRQFVRAWINAWDLRRLYPDFVEGTSPYDITQPSPDYTEAPETGQAPTENGPEPAEPEAPPRDDGW